MKRILVIGGSSGIGRKTVDAALARGYAVRLFARSAGKVKLRHDQLEKYERDALEPADVEGALVDCDAVVQALGVPVNARLLTGPIDLFSKATEILLPAMAKAGARRLIAVTGFGAGASEAEIPFWQRPAFKLFLGRAYEDKGLQERLIEASGLDWTIVRPVVLRDGPGFGRFQVLTDPRNFRNGVIARADVAKFIADQLNSDEFIGEAPVLRG